MTSNVFAPPGVVAVGGGLRRFRTAGPRTPKSSSIEGAGAATEIADLFEYTIATPGTVRKDESAMMPFLQQKVSARKLIIYSDSSKPNPSAQPKSPTTPAKRSTAARSRSTTPAPMRAKPWSKPSRTTTGASSTTASISARKSPPTSIPVTITCANCMPTTAF